ncbi:UvrB/UvrC motif-containing protein [Bacillus solimangrovi]|uniref:UVR domain-containing protein n=1 Tax=Bacillus solimangrovi TaxID=1305675 RepID=A0A1E5LGE9_9BACI|nr:UvrB/UvrC motif-containing protein [Bacillus solimangrovi]OEH93158.1 hypothetical protein BFG57_12855 [Bacillus solimangrovi]
MKCQECLKNPATLHFTKIINQEKAEFHLCEQCAREKGEMFAGNSGFTVSSLLSGLLNMESLFVNSSEKPLSNQLELECKSCGMTYKKFSEAGRFGCANCYQTFNEKLDPIFRRVHSGNTVHAGKIPKRIGGDLHVQKEISDLKDHLKKCVANEEFEQAAEIRDKIRSLEKSIIEKGKEA